MINVSTVGHADAIVDWIPSSAANLGHDAIGSLIQGFFLDGEVLEQTQQWDVKDE